MNTTQQHLPISDIKDGLLLLKNGGAALVLAVSAVNFGLLSEREQVAIISAFAQMLNSLSFSIQIVILSERLNISSYLSLLDKAQKMQTNPLLSKMMVTYRQFVQNTIKENDVLDKKFFVIIPLFGIEIGLKISKESLSQKVKTTLLPRRDQIIRQLSRVGLSSEQLTTQGLIELFFDIYNGEVWEETIPVKLNLNEPKKIIKQAAATPAQTVAQVQENQPKNSLPPITTPGARNHPFVVEELEEGT